MIKTDCYVDTEYKRIIAKKGRYSVVEFTKDLSVSSDIAQEAFFASEMNFRKRQLLIELDGKVGAYLQSGDMQLMIGSLSVETGITSAGDVIKKAIGAAVTDETIVKPFYYGEGILISEPTFNHILLEDVSEWGSGIVAEDGLFLACDETVTMEVTGRKNASSILFAKEGLVNLTLLGEGIVAFESPVPREELYTIDLIDDEVRIDGNMAIAWSSDLELSVDKTTPTLIGSLAAKEGLVNVYSGTGRVLVAPVRENKHISQPEKQ